MFPKSNLGYMNNFPRAIPVMPGSYPSSMPGMMPMPMPGPGMFPGTMQQGPGSMPMGEDTMGGGTMQQGPGSMQGGAMGGGGAMPITQSPFETAPGAPANLDTQYTQGYLRTQIGKRMRISFLLGTNTIQDREGVLTDVGISYVILRETQTNNLTLADIFSIKFVVIFPTT